MAIGLLSDGYEDEGVILHGHMFALPLDAVEVGSKRRAEESPYVNALDIGPYKHIQGEAIVPTEFEWCVLFPDDVDPFSAPEAPGSSKSLPTEDVLNFASNLLRTSSNPGRTASNPSAPKKPRLSPNSGSSDGACSRTSSANTIITASLGSPAQAITPVKALSRTSSSASQIKTPPNREEAPAASAAVADAVEADDNTKRGVNVRKNPQMQKTARDGQRHWHDKVQEMRMQYDMAHTGMVHPQFAEQRFMCSVRNLKCQKESLLIFLQFAMQQRLISPLSFVHPGDENTGFLGWTGFRIHPGCGPSFRAGVEALFPEPPKLNTLYHLFRRSGLVPEDWRRAWDGEIAFLWNPARSS